MTADRAGVDEAKRRALIQRCGAARVQLPQGDAALDALLKLGAAAGGRLAAPSGEVDVADTVAMAFGLCGRTQAEDHAIVAAGTAVDPTANRSLVRDAPAFQAEFSDALDRVRDGIGHSAWTECMLEAMSQLVGTPAAIIASTRPARRVGAALRGALSSGKDDTPRLDGGLGADYGITPATRATTVAELAAGQTQRSELSPARAGSARSPAASPGSAHIRQLEAELLAAKSARTLQKRARLLEAPGTTATSAGPSSSRLTPELTDAHRATESFRSLPPPAAFHGSQFSQAFMPQSVTTLGPGAAFARLGWDVGGMARRLAQLAVPGRSTAEDDLGFLPSPSDDSLAVEIAGHYAALLASSRTQWWEHPTTRPTHDEEGLTRVRAFYRACAAQHTAPDKPAIGVFEVKPLTTKEAGEAEARRRALAPAVVQQLSSREYFLNEERAERAGRQPDAVSDARRQVGQLGGAAVAYLTSSQKVDGLPTGALVDGKQTPALVPASLEHNRVGLIAWVVDSVSAFHGRERLYHHLLGPPLEKRIQTFATKLLFGEVSIAEAQRLLGGEPARVGAIQEAALLKSTKCDTMGREGVHADDVRFPQDFLRAMQRLEAIVRHIWGRCSAAIQDVGMARK